MASSHLPVILLRGDVQCLFFGLILNVQDDYIGLCVP